MAKPRRCRVYLDGAFQEAIFHGLHPQVTYGSDNEPRPCTVAVVELKSGAMKHMDPSKLKFLDQPGDEPGDRGEDRTSGDILPTVERLKAILWARARGVEPTDPDEYANLRRELVALPPVKAALPSFVISCRTVPEFWSFIQSKFPSYKERTDFLQKEFEKVLADLESGDTPGQPVADLFRHQFPAGLPFGLTKPNVVVKPQGGTQVLMFEAAADVGVIRAGAYPCLTFADLQAMASGTPVTSARFDEKLLALSQTDYEKTFFRQYATKYAMFTADVPVLVPQAWIQWHSLKKDDLRSAGSPYYADLYRVDFVAFWKNRRFALLIDDISHYGKKGPARWDADEEAYSKRLKEDRKLRKERWDVFRVSNWEIKNGTMLPEILTDLREFMDF